MEREIKRKSIDQQKRNFFVFQHFQVKWIAVLIVFFFLRITASTDQLLAFFYDAHSNIARIADPLNRTYTHQADSHGDLGRFGGSTVESAISGCTSTEGLRNEIESIKVPSESEIEKMSSVMATVSADLAQVKTRISSARSQINQKKDGFAGTMVDLQSFPGGTGREIRIADSSAITPEDLVKTFSETPTTSQSGERETIPTIGRDPDREDVSDLEKQAREKEARIRKEDVRKTQAKKKEEEDYDRKWTGIIQAIADLTRQQDEINLEKLRGKQKEAEQLLDAARHQTGGMLSDSDFQDRLDKMQSDFDAAKKALDEDIARSRWSSGPVECARDFTYDGHFNFDCNCLYYVFDFASGRCVPNKTPTGTGPIVRRTPDKSGLSDVVVNRSPTTLTVWDHGTEDLDRVNILLNRQLVRRNLTLRNTRQNIILYLRPGKNTLEVEALGTGDLEIQKRMNLPGVHAAAVEIQGVVKGKRRQQWVLMTRQKGYIQIYYQP